uniref:Uncharacterized protein n=1 Tax=Vitis vinifera TaxID=29760 RepID=F6H4S0_VITVI
MKEGQKLYYNLHGLLTSVQLRRVGPT